MIPRFRAWDKRQQHMVAVRSINWDSTGVISSIYVQYDTEIAPIQYSLHLGDFELMQFAELRDKNGREICEGDILCVNLVPEKPNVLLTVVWRSGALCLSDSRDGLCPVWFFFCGESQASEFEVVGNIWENSNLLKGEKYGNPEAA